MTNPPSLRTPHRDLYRLARLHGVQISYRDAFGRFAFVNPDALLGVLQGLNLPVHRAEDAAPALRQTEQQRWTFELEPCAAVWLESGGSVPLRVPAAATGRLRLEVRLEDGREIGWEATLEDLPISATHPASGPEFVQRDIPLPDLPAGYHDLNVELGTRRWQSFLIVAPRRAYTVTGRHSGYFAPLYALHSSRSWGTGDVTDLAAFARWVHEQGSDFVATLPLLPLKLGPETVSHSPYSPVSRLFWNELYADPLLAATQQGCDEAIAWYESPSIQARLEQLRHARPIDYAGTFALKREMISLLAPPAEVDPGVAEYARFRAVQEQQRKPWWDWPERQHNGDLRDVDFDPDVYRFFATAQQLISTQLARFSEQLKQQGQYCYLDLPIGSAADGFDTWKHQQLFAHGVQCGAPPDQLFTGGQAWGLPPMLPAEMRRSRYGYLRDVLRHHLSLADILRYDHVIGLHRLYWVPPGFSAREGIFVQYPAEELYAILSLESHRARSVIVGENLGTVPRRINQAMARHGIYETYVLQYEIPTATSRGIRPAPRRSLAGLNTHDMPTFKGFLDGKELKDQGIMGLRDADSVQRSLQERSQQVERLCRELEQWGLIEPGDREPERLLRAALEFLKSSQARFLVVNLEDLWLETEGQNMPGTAAGNWERRIAFSLEELAQKFPAPERPN